MMYLRKNLVRYIGLYLFPFSLGLPLPMIYSAIAFNIFILYLLFTVSKNEIKKFKDLFSNPLTLIFFAFFFTDLVHTLLTQNFENKIIRDVKLPFLIAPLLMLMRRDLLVSNFKSILASFSLGTVIYIVVNWCYVIYFYTIKNPNYIFEFNDHYVVYVLAKEFPNSMHHTYIGLYILFTATYIFASTIIFKNIKLFPGLLMCTFLLINSFYIGGKGTSVLIGVFMFVILVKSYFNNKPKGFVYYIIGLVGVCTIGIYGIKEWLSISIQNSIGFRYDIYKRCFEVSEEALPFGIGKKGLNSTLFNIDDMSLGNLVTHNIYFNELIMNGYIGLVTLLLMLGYLIYCGYKTNVLFFLLILSIIVIGGTEDLLYRQRGVIFFVFTSVLFYIKYAMPINKSNFDANLKK